MGISDAHEGVKAATARVLSTTWQRCRVHFQGNALAHAGKNSRRVVSAFIAAAVAQPDPAAAKAQGRLVADQARGKGPKLATLRDAAEEDVLAYMTFPQQHRAKVHWTNPIERLNGEIKRRTDVVGIFPNEGSIRRLVAPSRGSRPRNGPSSAADTSRWKPLRRSAMISPSARLPRSATDQLGPPVSARPAPSYTIRGGTIRTEERLPARMGDGIASEGGNRPLDHFL